MPTINLGYEFKDGQKVSPASLHSLIDEAAVTGFAAADFALGSIKFATYGDTRPTLARGAIHYDTTAGIEGLYYAWVTASNASISGWLSAVPRRECYCWAASAVSLGTPVFLGRPDIGGGPDYVNYDGCLIPSVYRYTGASGPDPAFFVTLESAAASSPVKCMWAGLAPPTLPGLGGFTPATPTYVDYADPGSLKSGSPSARNLIFGTGPVIHGAGCFIEDLS